MRRFRLVGRLGAAIWVWRDGRRIGLPGTKTERLLREHGSTYQITLTGWEHCFTDVRPAAGEGTLS